MTRRFASLALLLTLCLAPAAAAKGWRAAGQLLAPVGEGNAFALSDGGVVSVGMADDESGWPATTQFWSPKTHAWTAAASTPALPQLYEPRATMLDDGRILVTGYCERDCGGGANAELYDPARDKWSLRGQMRTGRYMHEAVKLLDGRVLAIGGCIDAERTQDTNAVEIFDPATGTFAPAAPMKHRRVLFRATLLADGRVLVSGGFNLTGALAASEVFDPASGRWSAVAPMAQARMKHVTLALADGRVLVAGGDRGDGWPIADAELFDPASGTWSRAGALHAPRESAAAALLADGTVLVAGGLSYRGTLWQNLTTTERFDPVTGAFRRGPEMAQQRAEFSLATLRNGRLIAVGGDAWLNSEPKYAGDAEMHGR